MAEMWFRGISPAAVQSVHVHSYGLPSPLADPNQPNAPHASEQHADGQLVPSCSTCQGVIPALLDGSVARFVAANPGRALVCNQGRDTDLPQPPNVVKAVSLASRKLAYINQFRPRAQSAFPNGRCTQTQKERAQLRPKQMRRLGLQPALKIAGQRRAIKKLRMMQALQPSATTNEFQHEPARPAAAAAAALEERETTPL